MAINNGPVYAPPAAAGPDTASHNAEIAKKLAAQDIMGASTAPQFNSDADAALDALAQQVQPKPDDTTDTTDTSTPPVTPAPDDAEAAKKAAEAAEAAQKADAEKSAKAAEEAEILKKAEESLFKGAPQLAPNASQKSADAFRAVKVRAALELSALQTKLDEATKKLEESAKQAGQPTKEQLELQEKVRDYEKRLAKLDVEADPKYKEYDNAINSASDFIYAQLKKHPAVTDAVIAEIKKYGGPDKVKLEKIFEAIKDDQTETLVKAKLADIAVARYNKEQAVTTAKQNIDQYIQEKQTESQRTATAYQDEVKKELNDMWSNLAWTKKREIPATASADDKTAAENHNKFVDQVRGELEDAIKNDNPKLRATLLTGIAQLFNLQNVHESLKKSHESLEKEVKELREYKDRVKKAGTSRLQESNAPTSGKLPAEKPANVFTTPATDALDMLAKQVSDERRAKLG